MNELGCHMITSVTSTTFVTAARMQQMASLQFAEMRIFKTDFRIYAKTKTSGHRDVEKSQESLLLECLYQNEPASQARLLARNAAESRIQPAVSM
ncbi:hypothetical protein LPB67_07360 [Undibacterium sp. Jales W-56]|uniref:hypothetical protein n=1 Tax=Undibacterium sp. Jales W-56 TaxID=2897325 RepID=UPI0021CEC594|nr:hypothetical protein [Undibacterium sp. Jales W-56]MCU6433593.1 hypothetical protein [Undibacterium sp. Jales W-56]